MWIDSRKSRTISGPPEWFTGPVWIEEIAEAPEPSRIRAHRVHFAPGARTAWHRHPVGQVLHVTGGVGWVQRGGGQITEVHPGDTVHVEPGELHWHGASPESFMTHLAIQESASDGTTADWFEHVTDEEYLGESLWPSSASAC
jgi:quercetin dioxygenase-like cupin family protein